MVGWRGTRVSAGQTDASDNLEALGLSQATPLVYSVVLSYNNIADSEECLQSLLAQDHPGHRVLLVDNGSSDGSLEDLRRIFGDRVEFIVAGTNLGVGAGYNLGLRAALAAGAEFVAVCNNDIVAAPDFISSMVRALSDESLGLIAPVITYYDRPGVVWFGGIRQHPLLFYTQHLKRDRPWSEVPRSDNDYDESDFVPTCATVFPRRALEEVGLLDPRFFFGHDDVDWCLRAHRRGYKCAVLNRPLVRHKVSVTSGVPGSKVMNAAAAYTYGQGTILVGAKHFRGAKAVPFWLGLLCLRIPSNVAQFLVARSWKSTAAYARGLASGVRRYGSAFLPWSRAIDDIASEPQFEMAPDLSAGH